jgi:hypothetical protein
MRVEVVHVHEPEHVHNVGVDLPHIVCCKKDKEQEGKSREPMQCVSTVFLSMVCPLLGYATLDDNFWEMCYFAMAKLGIVDATKKER